MGNGTEDPQAYNRQRKRMQGMQLMANGAASWKRRSNLDFGSVLFSVKAFFRLPVTPLLLYSLLPIVYRKSIFGITSYSLLLTPYYLLFSVKAFLGLPVTPYSFTPYYLLFSVKVFLGLPVTPYSFTPYYLLFRVKVFLGLPVTPYSFTPYYLLFRVKTYLGLSVGYAPNLISLYGVL